MPSRFPEFERRLLQPAPLANRKNDLTLSDISDMTGSCGPWPQRSLKKTRGGRSDDGSTCSNLGNVLSAGRDM